MTIEEGFEALAEYLSTGEEDHSHDDYVKEKNGGAFGTIGKTFEDMVRRGVR